MNYLLVMLGGAIGALSRYFCTLMVKGFGVSTVFATFGVNIFGSFMIGIAFALFILNRAEAHPLAPLFIPGVLGGFTTFSTFSLEIVQMLNDGKLFGAITYMALSLGLGVIACMLGIYLVRG